MCIHATSTARSAACLACGQRSVHPHSWYRRHPQDLPCIDQQLTLVLTVRRSYCRNAGCGKRTFVERFPDWLPFYARRTTRLTALMRRVGFEVSAESGRRILRFMHVCTSGDTLLRIVKCTPLPPRTQGRIVRMDDWAIRKGHRYGTLVIDHESHQVLEVVEGRLTDDIQPWLAAHPQVEVVTRDRSRDYRNALEATVPHVEQVADRWYLLLNLRQLAERIAASAYRRLKQLPLPPELRPARPQYLRSLSEQARREGTRQQRIDYYNEAQRLKQQGLTVSQVKVALGRNYLTVRFYYEADSFPERMPGRSPHSVLTPYLDYLETRFREGAVTARQLREELLAQGFSGSEGTVSKWLRARRLVEGQDPDIEITSIPLTDSSSALPSALRLSWLLVLPDTRLADRDRALLNHVLQDDVLAYAHTLIQQFRTALLDRDGSGFDAWMLAAQQACFRVSAP
ncbi:MAG: ISL3 family transposase, partial [Blastochloris sp.]|nr:ISL3 family transposase [Blastochloris sp.]